MARIVCASFVHVCTDVLYKHAQTMHKQFVPLEYTLTFGGGGGGLASHFHCPNETPQFVGLGAVCKQ